MKPTYTGSPAPVEAADRTLNYLLENLTWLEVTPARKEFFMSDKPRTYAYKTFDGLRHYSSTSFAEVVERYRLFLNVPGVNYNVCFLNRYDDDRNHLGWHADDSPEMDHDHPIAVVSFGAEREIWWKPKTHKGTVPPEWRQLLGHGSIFTMPAGFQREFLHRIPKCAHRCGPRVSLTFRRYIDKETGDAVPTTSVDVPTLPQA